MYRSAISWMPDGMKPITGRSVTTNQAQPAVKAGHDFLLNHARAVSAATKATDATTCQVAGPVDE